MTIGIIWHDTSKKCSPAQNVAEAIKAHIRRFGCQPDVIYVPLGCVVEADCPVVERRDVLRYDCQVHHREA